MAVSFYLTTEQYGAEGKDHLGNELPAGAIAFAPDDNSDTGKIYVKNVFHGTNAALVCFTPSDALKIVGDLAGLESGISDVIPTRTVVNAINYVFQELTKFKNSTMTPSEISSAINNAITQLGVVYKYKGSVNTYDELPASGVESGYVYNVMADNMNYAALVLDSFTVRMRPAGSTQHQDYTKAPNIRFTSIDATVKRGTSSSQTVTKEVVYVKFDTEGNVLTEGGQQVYVTSGDYYVYIDCPVESDKSPVKGTAAGETVEWDPLGAPFSLEWH